MTKFIQCIAAFASCFVASALFAAGCELGRVPTATPKPEPTANPTAEPPESWCQAACARWQMAGCKEGLDVCETFSADGECSRMVSCLAACEAEPHAYPTGACVANPPAVRMQTCTEIRAACP